MKITANLKNNADFILFNISSLESQDFVKMAKSICEVFETEVPATYYVMSSARSTRTGQQSHVKNRNAAGKLYNQYTKIKEKLVKANMRTKQRGSVQDPRIEIIEESKFCFYLNLIFFANKLFAF